MPTPFKGQASELSVVWLAPELSEELLICVPCLLEFAERPVFIPPCCLATAHQEKHERDKEGEAEGQAFDLVSRHQSAPQELKSRY